MGAVHFLHPQKTSRTGRLPSDPEDLARSYAWSRPGAAEHPVTCRGKPPLGKEAGRPLGCCPHSLPARRTESLLESAHLCEEGGQHVRFPPLRLPDRPAHLFFSQAVRLAWQSPRLSLLSHTCLLGSSLTRSQSRQQALSVSSPLDSAARLYEEKNACAQLPSPHGT
jgi:hypothetical protein